MCKNCGLNVENFYPLNNIKTYKLLMQTYLVLSTNKFTEFLDAGIYCSIGLATKVDV